MLKGKQFTVKHMEWINYADQEQLYHCFVLNFNTGAKESLDLTQYYDLNFLNKTLNKMVS